MATKKFEYEEEVSTIASTIMQMLPAISMSERLRLASSIFLVTTDGNGGKLNMKVETDEHRYTISITRENLSD